MKMIFHSLVVLLCTMALQAQASRTGGGFDHDNGGDICENTFKNVRDNLTTWILDNGAIDLRFPEGVTHDAYKLAMIRKIAVAKISCTDTKLFVGSAEKTCKNFFEADGTASILCNENRFMSTPTSEQYTLVHHEYAGLAGFEVNRGEDSNYQISNQIVRNLAGLRLGQVKLIVDYIAKVAVHPESTPKGHATKNNAICMYIGRMNQGEVIQDLFRQLIALDGNPSKEIFPDSAKTFNKLRINIAGLMNYCIEGISKEDPNPISFEDTKGLLSHITEIRAQTTIIENYLNKRFPHIQPK